MSDDINLGDFLNANSQEVDPNMVAGLFLMQTMLFGQAVGEALALPYVGKKRDTFTCTDMTGGGMFDQPAGTYAEHTSLLMATLDSLLASNAQVDQQDLRTRYMQWLERGRYSANGTAIPVDSVTESAIREGRGLSGDHANTSGSLTHVMPAFLFDLTDDEIRAISAVTQENPRCTDACVRFVRIISDVVEGNELEDTLKEYGFDGIWKKNRAEIESDTDVLHTLEAALWCVATTESYKDCVLTAVNLGGNTPAIAALAGSFASLIYGFEDDGNSEGIPETWMDQINGTDQFLDVILGGPEDDEELALDAPYNADDFPQVNVFDAGTKPQLVASFTNQALDTYDKAIALIDEAVLSDNLEFKSQRFLEASHLLEQSYDLGNIDATVPLGTLYYDRVIPADDQDKMALFWFNRGFEQGNAQCALYLGDMHRDGRGVESNLDTAFNFYDTAYQIAEETYDLTKTHDLGVFGLILLRLAESLEYSIHKVTENGVEVDVDAGAAAYMFYSDAQGLIQELIDRGADIARKDLKLAEEGAARTKTFYDNHEDE